MGATKYQDYLTANVLDEGRTISYRSLSRALKVHVNAAKEMLFDFHQTQNASKPDSLHASFLVYGTRKLSPTPHVNGSNSHNEGDVVMQDDSLAFSSSLPEAQSQDIVTMPIKTFTVVAQERLQEVKSSYDKIHSIHIYSLEPGPLSNMHMLSDCNQALYSLTSDEDPLETWKQYGTIHNPTAKRRGNRPAPPPTSTSQPSTAAMKSSKSAKAPETPKADFIQSSKPTTTPRAETHSKTATQQKPQASNLFKSFAKGTQNDTSKQPTTSANSHASATSKPEMITQDESMEDAPLQSDAEEVEDDSEHLSNLDTVAIKEKAEENRKAKAEREASLIKMMEQDDSEPEPDNSEVLQGDQAMNEAPVDDAEEEILQDDAVVNAQTAQQPDTRAESQEQVTTGNGRRRGRRQVMKKKRTKDADGWLVTKEEPVWESFSEDEVEPTSKNKSSTFSTGPASAPSKAKKSTSSSKPGQGNIMSFFGKK